MASNGGENRPRVDGPRALWLRSDERLAQWAIEGDERAFAAIFRRYGQELYRFSLGILGCPDDAQDALQATMVKALKALPGERREIQLKPWLYRIAHNESVELLRRRRIADELGPELASADPQPPERTEQRSRLRGLLDDLEELPERQRGALVMRELSGLEFEEIAGALQASPAVARQAIYEARTSLRQMEDGREMACESVTLALSDGDGRISRRRDLRAHLRGCSSCRRFREEMRTREADFAAIGPLPAAASTALLGSVVGGKVAAGGGFSGPFAGALGSSAVAKTAVAATMVATIGVSVAQREGLVDLQVPGGGRADSAPRSVAGDELALPTVAGQPVATSLEVAARRSRLGQGGPEAPNRTTPDRTVDPNADRTEPVDDASAPQAAAAPPAAGTAEDRPDRGPATAAPPSGSPAVAGPGDAPPGDAQSPAPPGAGHGAPSAPAGGPPADPGSPQGGPPESSPGKSGSAPPDSPGKSGSAPPSAGPPASVGGGPPSDAGSAPGPPDDLPAAAGSAPAKGHR